MNYILLVIISFSIFASSLKTKFCFNCKYFIKENNKNEIDNVSNKFGKCSLFPTTNYDRYYLVTGKDNILEYNYCSIVRDDEKMCGKEGKKHIRKYIKN